MARTSVMQRALCVAMAAAAILAVPPTVAASAPHEQAAITAASLEVTVTYKGIGEVKTGNEITVFLFDTPEINAQSSPIGMQVLEKNGGTVSFHGISVPIVYMALVYDENASYDAQGPPPPGTPVSIYSDPVGAPVGVKTGVGEKVAVTFDDTQRMP